MSTQPASVRASEGEHSGEGHNSYEQGRAVGWLSMSAWVLILLVGPEFDIVADAILNFLIAAVLGVVLYRRRRARRLDPQRIGQVFE